MKTAAARALLIAVLLAGCTPKPTAVAPSAAAAPTSAKAETPLDCAKAEATDAGDKGWVHPACRLTAQDGTHLTFDAAYGAVVVGSDGDTTPVSIVIKSQDGGVLQTVAEEIGQTFGAPSLEDIDKDGLDELLVPLETGNVNTTFALWRRSSAAGPFLRIGEINAVEIRRTDSGFIAASARSSANAWSVQFFKLNAESKLAPVLNVTVEAQGEADKITGVACRLEDGGDLKSLGLNRKTAEAKFCAEPFVKSIFQ